MKKQTDPKAEQNHIASLIEEIETYWLCHPFWAISNQGSDENPVEIYNFSLGKMALDPSLPVNAKCFEENLEILWKKTHVNDSDTRDKEAEEALAAIDSLNTGIAKGCERIGYHVGVLMGAKLMGASRAQLEQLCQGLAKHLETEES